MMEMVLCAGCSGEYPATSLDGGRCHACLVRSRRQSEPEYRPLFQATPCLHCSCLNLRAAGRPAPTVCGRCGRSDGFLKPPPVSLVGRLRAAVALQDGGAEEWR